MFISTAQQLLEYCKKNKCTIAQYGIDQEVCQSGYSPEKVRMLMERSLDVMENSATYAFDHKVKSVSGLTGGDAQKYYKYTQNGDSLCGDVVASSVAMALSCSEVNASMRRIVACPTAGSCGIVPAVILSIGKKHGKTKQEMVDALFTASIVGVLIANNATLAGAEGGCQAECGAAAAMASAAAVEMMGGCPEMAFHGAAMALKSVLGLVCDPVCGLVEIPCIKRNASGAANAVICADMALAGVESYIPFDEVVWAMNQIGKRIPPELRETSLGGLAVTPTAKKYAAKLHIK